MEYFNYNHQYDLYNENTQTTICDSLDCLKFDIFIDKIQRMAEDILEKETLNIYERNQ